jgi:hypothetical protein
MSRSTHWPTVDEPPRRSIRQLLAMGWRRTSPGAAVGGCGPSILPRSPWRPRFVHAQRPDGAGKPTWKQEPRAGEGSPPRVGMFGATPADWDNRVQAPACRGFQGPQGLCGDCLRLFRNTLSALCQALRCFSISWSIHSRTGIMSSNTLTVTSLTPSSDLRKPETSRASEIF